MVDKEKAQAKPQRKLKSFTDVFGDGEFYPDVQKVDFKDILDNTYVLEDAKILRDFTTEYGKHDAGLMLMANTDNADEKFTTICSGQVVVERLERAIKQRVMPILCTPVEVTSGRNKYYNLK